LCLRSPYSLLQGSGQAEEDIVAGKLMAADVVTLKPANTVEGRPVKIMENGRTVMINNATATKADILCD
jgi:uncharacterized surface protein with fasciclin (FAS1) repeats